MKEASSSRAREQYKRRSRKITARLRDLGISYAVVGGMALFSHGLRRFTEVVDLLVTHDGLKEFHQRLEGLGYLPPFNHSKNLRDTETGVKIEFLITGAFPGDGKPKPVAFPDPAAVAEERDEIHYVNLRTLIELKIASGMTSTERMKDLADVQELIKILNLPLEFAEKLNPYVQEKYNELWTSARPPQKRYVRILRNDLTADAAVQAMLADGVTLDSSGGAAGDHVYLVTSNPDIAKKYDMHEESEYLHEADDDVSKGLVHMLSIFGSNQRLCDGVSRRAFLKVGALAVGGLTLADILRLKAHGAVNAETSAKAIIMVYLNGGPSHMDMYDLKPDAPVEYRGEFRPIRTNVLSMDICEHMPMQARIADKFAIIRNMRFRQQGHTSPELYTGLLTGNRPSIGSIVSKLRRDAGVVGAMPPFVSMGDGNHVPGPGFLGKAHEPYQPGPRSANLGLANGITRAQLDDRRALLGTFDSMRRDLDGGRGNLVAMDAFNTQALEMVTSNRARDAFDISREPESIRNLYGRGTDYLRARRLVEAGVPVVTLTPENYPVPRDCNGQWDHHDHIFTCLPAILPAYDRSIYALLTDLHQRGLDRDVAVVVWGEMGRTPRVGAQRGTVGGRDHWPQSGFALMAGGGLRTGQVVGATDRRGENPQGRAYTPQNVLATLYHVLGIDPATTINDHQGRPLYLLDDRAKVAELV